MFKWMLRIKKGPTPKISDYEIDALRIERAVAKARAIEKAREEGSLQHLHSMVLKRRNNAR